MLSIHKTLAFFDFTETLDKMRIGMSSQVNWE